MKQTVILIVLFSGWVWGHQAWEQAAAGGDRGPPHAVGGDDQPPPHCGEEPGGGPQLPAGGAWAEACSEEGAGPAANPRVHVQPQQPGSLQWLVGRPYRFVVLQQRVVSGLWCRGGWGGAGPCSSSPQTDRGRLFLLQEGRGSPSHTTPWCCWGYPQWDPGTGSCWVFIFPSAAEASLVTAMICCHPSAEFAVPFKLMMAALSNHPPSSAVCLLLYLSHNT